MEIIKVISTVFFLIVPLQVRAGPSPCFENQKISLPPQVLYFYFSSPGLLRALPLGNQDCDIPRSSIDVVNSETGQRVGIYQHERKIKTIYNEYSDRVGISDKAIKSIFASLNGTRMNPILFAGYLGSLISPNSLLSTGSEQKFSLGRMVEIVKGAIGWDPYTPPSIHGMAKSISYDEFIQFLGRKDSEFVHVDIAGSFEVPILNNQVNYISNMAFFQTPLDQIVSRYRFNPKIRQNPIVVVSKTQNAWLAYNTITNLNLSGYRNIFWFHNSSSVWRNKLLTGRHDYYLNDFRVVTNAELNALLSADSSIKLLDLSDGVFNNQVRFRNAILRKASYLNPKEVKELIAKNTKTPSEVTLNSRLASEGYYFVADSSTLFPKPSKIVLMTNEHHEGSAVLRSVYKTLAREGHDVSILKTNAGGFLSYLVNLGIDPNRFILEKSSMFEKMETYKAGKRE